jgi:hypothetical protein
MGKPAGWGSVWHKQDVKAGEVSDPFLMTGFDKKVMHLKQVSNKNIRFKIEVDFLGDGSWETYETIAAPGNSYIHHEFPASFSAHWVRVTASDACNATVTFIYN